MGGDTQPGRNRALIGICLSFFMVVLDTTVANAALPAVQRSLGGMLETLQWVVNGYTVVFASLLLTAGTLGDRLGSKRVFVAGLLVFTAASGVCSQAPTLETLQAGRLLQGVGAAAISRARCRSLPTRIPTPQTGPRDWHLGGMSGLGIVSGLVLGGLLTSLVGWQSVFLLNIPAGLVAAALTRRYARETTRTRGRGFDISGQVLAIVMLGAITYVLIEGWSQGWFSGPILSAIFVSALVVPLFLIIESRGRSPMLPPRLFRTPTFTVATLVGFHLNFRLYGTLFVLSLFFQQILDYSPFATGLAFLSLTVVIACSVVQSGSVTGRWGPERPMIGGLRQRPSAR